MLEVRVRHRFASDGHQFDLDAQFRCEQDVTVIFGPSGSGKSVTLQAVAGLLRPREGLVRLGDRVLFDASTGIDLPARQRRVAYVFQDYALFPHLSVERNVAFPLQPWWRLALGSLERRRVAEMLDVFEIGHLAASYPAQLSAGGSPSLAHWSGSPNFCCWTNPSVPWTRFSGNERVTSCFACGIVFACPWSSSRTIRTMSPPWQTA